MQKVVGKALFPYNRGNVSITARQPPEGYSRRDCWDVSINVWPACRVGWAVSITCDLPVRDLPRPVNFNPLLILDGRRNEIKPQRKALWMLKSSKQKRTKMHSNAAREERIF